MPITNLSKYKNYHIKKQRQESSVSPLPKYYYLSFFIEYNPQDFGILRLIQFQNEDEDL